MSNKVDIKEMLSQAFQEIYDQSIDTTDLEAIFAPKKDQNFTLRDLDYRSKGVDEYTEEFLGCLKHSFQNVVSYHSEFEVYSHDTQTRDMNDKNHTQNNAMPCNTPLTEVNNLLQKFTFISNLHGINVKYTQSVKDVQLGLKRKHPNQGMPNNLTQL